MLLLPRKVRNPLSCGSRVRPAGVPKLGADRTGRERCVQCPLRCSYPAVHMEWEPGSCWGQTRAALALTPWPAPVSEASGAQQRVTTLVAQESRQMFVLSSSELHSLRYGFAPGFGRLSFLSFANNKDEGLYVMHWIMMAIFENLDMAVPVQTWWKFFYPHGIKFKCRTVDPCGRGGWQ